MGVEGRRETGGRQEVGGTRHSKRWELVVDVAVMGGPGAPEGTQTAVFPRQTSPRQAGQLPQSQDASITRPTHWRLKHTHACTSTHTDARADTHTHTHIHTETVACVGLLYI